MDGQKKILQDVIGTAAQKVLGPRASKGETFMKGYDGVKEGWVLAWIGLIIGHD